MESIYSFYRLYNSIIIKDIILLHCIYQVDVAENAKLRKKSSRVEKILVTFSTSLMDMNGLIVHIQCALL